MRMTLKEMMAGRSDEDLITFLTSGRDQFTAASIAAARTEFDRRSISAERKAALTERQARHREQQQCYANEPLPKSAAFVATAFPVIARLVYIPAFNRAGYERRLDELDNAACRGYLLRAGVVLLGVLVSRFFF